MPEPGPRIGVTGPTHWGRTAWLFTRWALRRAGGRATRLYPADGSGLEGLDALVIGGGADIHPRNYGQAPRVPIRGDAARDAYELRLLDAAAARGLPVLGLCRGAQLINVHRGGDLHQDIRDAEESFVYLRTVFPRKPVQLTADSLLMRLMGTAEPWINSLHTQSVARLGEGLSVAARDEHRVIQAIEGKGGAWTLGVQWHPEYLPQLRSHSHIFRGVVDAARARA